MEWGQIYGIGSYIIGYTNLKSLCIWLDSASIKINALTSLNHIYLSAINWVIISKRGIKLNIDIFSA